MTNLKAANHDVLENIISGTVDTSSISGDTVVSLRIKGMEVTNAKLQDSIAGLQATAALIASGRPGHPYAGDVASSG